MIDAVGRARPPTAPLAAPRTCRVMGSAAISDNAANPANRPVRFLRKGKVRSLEDVQDYATLCARGLLTGEIHPKLSRELRAWGELLFTCGAALRPRDQPAELNVAALLIKLGDTRVGVEPPHRLQERNGVELLSALGPTRQRERVGVLRDEDAG